MTKFEIVCDGAADLPEAYAQENNIAVVPFYVSLDGKTYMKEKVEISVSKFYQAMIDHADCFPKTSMPSVQDFLDVFTPIVKEGRPLLCICLTHKFSGSYQSAMNARMTLLEEYPDAQIYVMDSLCITAEQALLVQEAVRLKNMGLSLEEAVPPLEDIRGTGHIFFTTKDLKYLEHGGRLGKVSSIAGSVLGLKPVLHFCNGELAPTEVCRGRKKSLQKVVDNFFKYLEENHLRMKDCLLSTGIGYPSEEYTEFQKMLQQRFEETCNLPDSWLHIQIGATIGVHTGPYPMGLCILNKCKI